MVRRHLFTQQTQAVKSRLLLMLTVLQQLLHIFQMQMTQQASLVTQEHQLLMQLFQQVSAQQQLL